MPGKTGKGSKSSGAASPAASSPPSDAKIRLDKWLWHARFFKTRTLAAGVCRARSIRLNGSHVSKASVSVGAGDVLTFPQGDRILTVRVLACGERRGPAPEAQALYDDLTPPPLKPDDPETMKTAPVATRDRGAGRPTKAERRATDKLKDWD
ncbi:RNA-binding S4 domain-containing protein [Kordiimonas marina]|uniref:RNA-binding S4 domain-containing protein n=1 Tax=Kordiimonas marina TaxID=2872312 RepID=UPI001FF2082F|nr:RNA-binding S4 domain-containing protein [Kordiimonas marina]MCJ9428151.1 RNA-binding S4 domain-containing protein [Kordiimonas marina]